MSLLESKKTAGLFLLALPVIFSPAIWQQSFDGIALPLDDHFFENLYLGGQLFRISLPSWSSLPLLLVLSLMGPLALLANYLLLSTTLPLKSPLNKRLALVVCTALLSFAYAGQFPSFLLKSAFCLLLFSCLTDENPPHLGFWVKINSCLLIALLFQTQLFITAWAFISLSVAFCFEFFFVKKFKTTVQERRRFRKSFFSTAGFILTMSAGLLLITQSKWLPTEILSFPIAWFALLPLSLCLVLARLDAWNSEIWLRLSTFLIGAFISSELFLMGLIISVYLILRSGQSLSPMIPEGPWTKVTKHSLSLRVLALGIAIGFSLFFSQLEKPERELSARWLATFDLLEQESNQKGIALFGEAGGLLSLFYKGKILENPEILLESNEDNLRAWMQTHEIDVILLDLKFIRKQWLALIQKKENIDKINQSIISRATLYQGEALQTKTLNLEPLLQFTASEIEDTDIFKLSYQERAVP